MHFAETSKHSYLAQDTNLLEITYVTEAATTFAACIYFGWGSDVNPKKMLWHNTLLTIAGFVMYVLCRTFHYREVVIFCIACMSASSTGWLIIIFTYLREHSNRNDHIAT